MRLWKKPATSAQEVPAAMARDLERLRDEPEPVEAPKGEPKFGEMLAAEAKLFIPETLTKILKKDKPIEEAPEKVETQAPLPDIPKPDTPEIKKPQEKPKSAEPIPESWKEEEKPLPKKMTMTQLYEEHDRRMGLIKDEAKEKLKVLEKKYAQKPGTFMNELDTIEKKIRKVNRKI